MPHLISKSKIKGMVNISVMLILTFLIANCSKHQNPKPSPEKATLVFPAQNALCTSGTVLSNTEASIVLTWSAAAHTDSYEIDIKNLITGTIAVQTSTGNQITATLSRNTPYSWFVVSKSNSLNTTAQSDTWKFYLAGSGAITYSPFPAVLVAPAFGASVTAAANAINLTWTGGDVDNDITGYDIYFGSTSTPSLLKSNVTDMFLNGVTVTSGSSYYWKIVTKDTQGNTSNSGVYYFKVN
ncbi:fibronectin type III domain-containing protein [Mucilaginibacter xinganensis]|uniref:Fibronectin type-III domain-containing protein n=1 Tax=Mucilaginibacter xinganensis TaxID=1234841 RepID=A0A223NV21_9SPHI|nr:hypothetical protein [Mucilaginibacter xinganensis]ASU33729.1 hypothetical protein MuYL_1833 [Mucilaginibacter xinganensis]